MGIVKTMCGWISDSAILQKKDPEEKTLMLGGKAHRASSKWNLKGGSGMALQSAATTGVKTFFWDHCMKSVDAAFGKCNSLDSLGSR